MLEQDNNEQDVSCNNGANGSVSNINLNSCELERSGDGGIKNRILNVDNGNGGGEGSVAV
jgi:hypothetical protein